MTNVCMKSLLHLLLLFLQGCAPHYNYYDQASKVSGHIYSYENEKSLENISIEMLKSDTKGYFELPRSDTDGEHGFHVAKNFTLSINEKDVTCLCNTIGPYDTEACNKIQFFVEPYESAFYETVISMRQGEQE